ncbi:FMN-linked oxidoreductase [Ramaria rubella]|nr:FMN-linked oxidoreductase [Ramaria rubella]
MPSLSSPLVIGEAQLRNRNVHSAMTRNRASINVPNEYNCDYYTQRAAGGAGLIITEGTLVSQQGTEWPNAPGIWNTDQIRAWNLVVQSVHKAGGTIFCQLWHVGRLSHPDMPEHRTSRQPVLAPSSVPARGGKFRFLPGVPGYVTPTAVKDPWDLVLAYKNAAQNAKQAGFDGVELHAGGGYLPHQFLDYSSNRRTDQWGGSAANRSRFIIEVIRALVEVWGYDRVGIKLSPTGGLNDVGMTLQDTLDTYTYLIQQLDRLRVIYITLVRYVEAQDPKIDGHRRGTPHDVLEAYREHIKRPYLFLNAGISVLEAEDLLRRRVVDAIAFGRLWISHPDLQRRIERGIALDSPIDFKTLNGHSDVDPRKGYTDYPFAPGTI